MQTACELLQRDELQSLIITTTATPTIPTVSVPVHNHNNHTTDSLLWVNVLDGISRATKLTRLMIQFKTAPLDITILDVSVFQQQFDNNNHHNKYKYNLPSSLTHLTLSGPGVMAYCTSTGFFADPAAAAVVGGGGGGGLLLPHGNLVHLDLSYASLDTCHISKVVTFISQCCPHLRTLHLCGNFIGPKGIEELARTMTRNHCTNTTSSSESVSQASCLQYVDLRGNFGTHQAIDALCHWVEATPSLGHVLIDGDGNDPAMLRLQTHLIMNRMGRHYVQNYHLSTPLWAHVLAKTTTNTMYHIVRERPDVVFGFLSSPQ